MKCLHVSTILTVCFVVCTGIFAQDNAKPESTEKNGVNTYAQLLKKQSEALEFAENAKNFSRRPVRDPKPLYIPTPKDKERGLVFYQPLMITPFRGEQPSPKDVKRTLSIEAAGGEHESVIMAALALKDCKQISFNVNTQPEALHGVTIEILPVVMGPVRRGKTTYDFQALWVPDIPAPVDMKKNDRKAWLVRVYVPKQTAEGEYSIRLSYSSAHGKPQNGPALHLRVLPFDLVDPWKQGYMFGAFCSGADFNRAQYRQMKAHGIEGIQWFWGHYGMSPKRIINDNGTLRMDFTPMDRTISRFKAAGLRGPIVLAFGNYYASNFERVICSKDRIPQMAEQNTERKARRQPDPGLQKENLGIHSSVPIWFKGLDEKAERERLDKEAVPPFDEFLKAFDALLTDLNAVKDLEKYESGQLAYALNHLNEARELLKTAENVRKGLLEAATINAMQQSQIRIERGSEAMDAEPAPRVLSTPVYDAKTGLYVLFGGDHFDYLKNDTWVFDPEKRNGFRNIRKVHLSPEASTRGRQTAMEP